jgi:hypothetical protein
MRKTIAILVVLILASIGPQAKADPIIYNNLVSTTYVAIAGYTVEGANEPLGQISYSQTFVAGVTADLSDILLPMWTIGSPTSPAFNFSLTNSSNTVLESWTGLVATDGAGYPPPTISVMDVASVLHPLLTKGDTYTLTASPNNASTSDGWDVRNSLDPGITSGFRVLGEGTTTPEPATLTLLGTGLLAFGGLRLRRWRLRPSTT